LAQASALLTRTLERLNCGEAVLDKIPTAVVSINDHNLITVWNEAATETFGFTQEEAVGADLCELLVPAPFGERCSAGVARLLDGKPRRHTADTVMLVPAVRKDGSTIKVEMTLSVQQFDSSSWCAVAAMRPHKPVDVDLTVGLEG